jgi:hypothetical protein
MTDATLAFEYRIISLNRAFAVERYTRSNRDAHGHWHQVGGKFGTRDQAQSFIDEQVRLRQEAAR